MRYYLPGHLRGQLIKSVVALIAIISSCSLSFPQPGKAADLPLPTVPRARLSVPAVKFKLDPKESTFQIQAFASGLLSALAHNHRIAVRDFSGDVEFSPETIQPASLRMIVRADSLAIIDKVSDSDRQDIEHRMKAEALETAKFPEIIFQSTGITANKTADGKYHLKIDGDLSLHGVTRHGQIQANLTMEAGRLRAQGEFPLRLTDYRITPPAVAAGTIKVKDDLRISFNIVAHQ